MLKTCQHCGMEVKDTYWWFSNDYCTRTCAEREARELKEKYWEIRRLLKEKK